MPSAQERPHATSASGNESRTIDLSAVDVRLFSISADQTAARFLAISAEPRPSPPTSDNERTPPPFPISEAERHFKDLQFQTKCYEELIKDGGRPSHPLGHLGETTKDSRQYRDILLYWQREEIMKDEWRVFSRQLLRWNEFLWLQQFARGQSAYDYWQSVKNYKSKIDRWQSAWIEWGPVFMNILKSFDSEDRWEEQWQNHYKKYSERRVVRVRGKDIAWRAFVKREGRQFEQESFSGYAQALKERLARHGFTRGFQLTEDASQQDRLTTWFEYLGYECWWYDQHLDSIKRRQQQHDSVRKELVDANVIKQGETEEVLDGMKAELESEEESAEKTVQRLMRLVQSGARLTSPTPKLSQQRKAAQSALEAAMEKQKEIKRRKELVSTYFRKAREYRTAEFRAGNQSVLLRWIVQQVPLIEDEMRQPAPEGRSKRLATMSSADAPGPRKRPKTSRACEETEGNGTA